MARAGASRGTWRGPKSGRCSDSGGREPQLACRPVYGLACKVPHPGWMPEMVEHLHFFFSHAKGACRPGQQSACSPLASVGYLVQRPASYASSINSLRSTIETGSFIRSN